MLELNLTPRNNTFVKFNLIGRKKICCMHFQHLFSPNKLLAVSAGAKINSFLIYKLQLGYLRTLCKYYCTLNCFLEFFIVHIKALFAFMHAVFVFRPDSYKRFISHFKSLRWRESESAWVCFCTLRIIMAMKWMEQ